MIIVRYVTPEPRAELRGQVAELARSLGAKVLGKDPNVTAVLVEEADRDGWFVAGERPALSGKSAFWLDIKITAGTNTKSDTTTFVREAFDGMERLIGPLHPESYVFVHAVDGDAYGYGRRTQNGRWAEAHPR
jgi:4-oxalocrotonate tautomerase